MSALRSTPCPFTYIIKPLVAGNSLLTASRQFILRCNAQLIIHIVVEFPGISLLLLLAGKIPNASLALGSSCKEVTTGINGFISTASPSVPPQAISEKFELEAMYKDENPAGPFVQTLALHVISSPHFVKAILPLSTLAY